MSDMPDLKELLNGDFEVEWKSLGDIADLNAGGTPARKNPSYWQGDIPWVKISDISKAKGPITETEEYITEEGVENSAAKLLSSGTLLISIFASIGKVATLGTNAATNQAIVGITPKDHVDSAYLQHVLEHYSQSLVNKGKGAAQSNINLSILKNMTLPLPPLEIQKTIADTLDKFTDLEAELEAELEARVKQYEYYRKKLLTFQEEKAK